MDNSINGISPLSANFQTGKTLPLSIREAQTTQRAIPDDRISLSELARFAQFNGRAAQNLGDPQHVNETPGAISDKTNEGRLSLGLMALGRSTVEGWQQKGLDVDQEAILAAAEAFQSAFKEAYELAQSKGLPMSKMSVSINVHQLVMNHQDVPQWFADEYQSALQLMDKKSRTEFEQGGLFAVHVANTPQAGALGSYTDVARQFIG